MVPHDRVFSDRCFKRLGSLQRMVDVLEIKREVELLSDRLGKTQDYL